MKAIILAGGSGTRISEETHLKPKPMIEIGGKPILWHIMKIYTAHGINEFIVCLGYKGYVIKEYFANYALHVSDVTFDLKSNKIEVHRQQAEPWRITLVDTGEKTMTGGRLKRIQEYTRDEDFCFTYGDGVGNVDITKLIEFHRNQRVFATVTATRPPARFGSLKTEGDLVQQFQEKPAGDNGWINGGFFVLTPHVFKYIESDETVWEQLPLERLAADNQLAAYRHEGFWHPLDTLRDKHYLEELWSSGDAAWKVW
jgi:glucose-1-phosphate cytidylyltransferase